RCGFAVMVVMGRCRGRGQHTGWLRGGSERRVDEQLHLAAGPQFLESLLDDAAEGDGVDPPSRVVVAAGHEVDDGAVVVAGVADGALDTTLAQDEVDQRGGERIDGGPRSAIVVGAGIVGLSTAWFLQERGVDVTVVDRTGVAAGASWGNAGWISPALSIPLNSPGVLRYGLRSL